MNVLTEILKNLPNNWAGFATVCALVAGAVSLRIVKVWAWIKHVADKQAVSRSIEKATSSNQRAMLAQNEPPPPPPAGLLVLGLLSAAALSALLGGIGQSLQMARRSVPDMAAPADMQAEGCIDCNGSGCKCRDDKCQCPSKVPSSKKAASSPHSLASISPWFVEPIDIWPSKAEDLTR